MQLTLNREFPEKGGGGKGRRGSENHQRWAWHHESVHTDRFPLALPRGVCGLWGAADIIPTEVSLKREAYNQWI